MTIQNMQMHLHRGVMDEMSRKDALQKQSVAARWKKIHDFLLNQGAKEDDAASSADRIIGITEEFRLNNFEEKDGFDPKLKALSRAYSIEMSKAIETEQPKGKTEIEKLAAKVLKIKIVKDYQKHANPDDTPEQSLARVSKDITNWNKESFEESTETISLAPTRLSALLNGKFLVLYKDKGINNDEEGKKYLPQLKKSWDKFWSSETATLLQVGKEDKPTGFIVLARNDSDIQRMNDTGAKGTILFVDKLSNVRISNAGTPDHGIYAVGMKWD